MKAKKSITLTETQKIALLLFAGFLAVYAFGVHFGYLSAGDLTSGKQIIQVCEQTLAVGQSKDFFSCLGVYNSYADNVGDLYIKNIENYRDMRLNSITEIMCHNEGDKQYITVKTSGGSQYTNFVRSASGSGSSNPYELSTAMTSITSGGKIIYIRFDGCIYPSSGNYSVTCPTSSWTNCNRATSTNVKVWIPTSAQYEVKCLAGWTDTQECWDGSTITTMQCVDYQKVSTHNSCPPEPTCASSCPSGQRQRSYPDCSCYTPTTGGGTSGNGTSGGTACPPVGTMAHANWNTVSCSWECASGYSMIAGTCQIPSEEGTTEASPETGFDMVEYIIGNALLVVGALAVVGGLAYLGYNRYIKKGGRK